MIHDFGVVWSERALLLSGLANTAILSTLAAIAALVLGTVLTPALMSPQRQVVAAARTFVDGMRCVPFLLFAYIVYYGLPSLGLRFDNWTSGLAALTRRRCDELAAIEERLIARAPLTHVQLVNLESQILRRSTAGSRYPAFTVDCGVS